MFLFGRKNEKEDEGFGLVFEETESWTQWATRNAIGVPKYFGFFLTEEEQSERGVRAFLARQKQQQRADDRRATRLDASTDAYAHEIAQLTAIWRTAYLEAEINGITDESMRKQIATIALLREAYVGGVIALQWRTFSKPIAQMIRDLENPQKPCYHFEDFLKDLIRLKKTPAFNANGKLAHIFTVLNVQAILKTEIAAATASLTKRTHFGLPDEEDLSISSQRDDTVSDNERIQARIMKILEDYTKVAKGSEMKVAVLEIMLHYTRDEPDNLPGLCGELKNLNYYTVPELLFCINQIAQEFPAIWAQAQPRNSNRDSNFMSNFGLNK